VFPILLGAALLLGFYLWERRLTNRPGGRPLVDLALFRSASYTWGVTLAAVCLLAMIGVIFSMPQYFQAIQGTDAMGSGLRLLPLIGGLVAGAVPADRVVRRIGAKFAAAAGFAILALALLVGATTGVDSSAGFVAVWMAAVGLGMGLALATCASAALAELTEERSGVGSAVMQAFQKVGGPFGAAILGSVLSSGYRAQLDLAGLPPAVAAAARASIFGGLAVAHRIHSPALLDSARMGFVNGLDSALVLSAGIAAVGILLTLAFLPGRQSARAAAATKPLTVGG
jgi:Na+/melibiose symporter-like transporter